MRRTSPTVPIRSRSSRQKNENGQFFEMLMAEELDSKNLDNAGFDGQLSFGGGHVLSEI